MGPELAIAFAISAGIAIICRVYDNYQRNKQKKEEAEANNQAALDNNEALDDTNDNSYFTDKPVVTSAKSIEIGPEGKVTLHDVVFSNSSKPKPDNSPKPPKTDESNSGSVYDQTGLASSITTDPLVTLAVFAGTALVDGACAVGSSIKARCTKFSESTEPSTGIFSRLWQWFRGSKDTRDAPEYAPIPTDDTTPDMVASQASEEVVTAKLIGDSNPEAVSSVG
jgi:hypothetical protein